MHIDSLEIPSSLSLEFSRMFFKAIILKSFGGGVFPFFKRDQSWSILKINLFFFFLNGHHQVRKKETNLVIKIVLSLSDMHFMDSFLHYVSRTICKK